MWRMKGVGVEEGRAVGPPAVLGKDRGELGEPSFLKTVVYA